MIQPTAQIIVILLTALCTTSGASNHVNHGGEGTTSCDTNNITIHYSISYDGKDPNFEYSTTVTGNEGQPFIRFMEQAADKNKSFQFSVNYHQNLGYLVQTINGVSGEYNKTFWHLMKAPSEKLLVGVSQYFPVDGDRLILKHSQVQSWTILAAVG